MGARIIPFPSYIFPYEPGYLPSPLIFFSGSQDIPGSPIFFWRASRAPCLSSLLPSEFRELTIPLVFFSGSLESFLSLLSSSLED
jgi:hypothetical protein